jgi:ATP-binding cassette, subfamily D (ALD), peroxisomal long-chain fatty acid import protein
LTRYVHDLYLSEERNFYKTINLDTAIESPDQYVLTGRAPTCKWLRGAFHYPHTRYITTDILRFCETLASLYSNVSKPTLDLILFGFQLGRSIGRWGGLGLFVTYFSTAWILRRVTPAFGRLAAVEAKLEGDFRGAHSRLITNAEEIACVIHFWCPDRGNAAL